MKRLLHRWLTILVVATLLPASALPRTPAAHAQDAQADDAVFLPLIGVPPGPPQFTIISPATGLSISGTSIFAVQPVDSRTVRSVAFRAGNVELGVDDTPADGFQIYLDASQLPAGPLTLSARATGPTGETATRTVNVTVAPQPPSSAG